MTIANSTTVDTALEEQEETVETMDTSHNGIVITVTSAIGGAGKSTVTSLLGTQLAKSSEKAFQEGKMERPLKVCLVDLDIFDSQLGFLLGATKPTSLNIALSDEAFGPEIIRNSLIYSSRMGLHALLAPLRYDPKVTELDADFYRMVINTLRSMFDVIILDTSVQHYSELIKDVALPDSDAILLIATLNIGSINSTKRWVHTAEAPLEKQGYGIDMKKVGLVINQAVKNLHVDGEVLQEYLPKVPKLVAIPLDTVAVQGAGNSHHLESLIEDHPSIGNAYFSLAQKITAKLDLGVTVNLSPIVNK